MNEALTDPQVIISDQTGSELAVKEIVCRVNGADARVRIIVGIHAKTEWARTPQRCCAPMIVIVLETVHLFG